MIKELLVNLNSYIEKNFFTMIRHLLVSGICALIDLFTFIYLYEVNNFSLFSSYMISIMITTFFGFIGHSLFTFNNRNITQIRTIMLFIAQVILSITIGYSIIFILVEIIKLNVFYSKILQMSATFFFNFNFGKYITFKIKLKN